MLCAQEMVRRRIPFFNINAYMYNTLVSRCTRTSTFTQSTLAHAPNNNTVEYAVKLHHPPPTHIMETEPALGRERERERDSTSAPITMPMAMARDALSPPTYLGCCVNIYIYVQI